MTNITEILEEYRKLDPNTNINNAQGIENKSNQSIKCLDPNFLPDSVQQILSENNVKEFETYINIINRLFK
jgi:hypothetical protein